MKEQVTYVQNTTKKPNQVTKEATAPTSATPASKPTRPFRDRSEYYRYVSDPKNEYGGTIANDR